MFLQVQPLQVEPLVVLCPVGTWSAEQDATVSYVTAPEFASSAWDWIGLYRVSGVGEGRGPRLVLGSGPALLPGDQGSSRAPGLFGNPLPWPGRGPFPSLLGRDPVLQGGGSKPATSTVGAAASAGEDPLPMFKTPEGWATAHPPCPEDDGLLAGPRLALGLWPGSCFPPG